MPDYGHPLRFGALLTPDARRPEHTVALARLADQCGLDILGVTDHPYLPDHMDMWTLLSALAGRTERITLFPDVVNLPLRPPAVLARAAATLDQLSGARVELGLGTGVNQQAVASVGGTARRPGQAVAALEEAVKVLRALWTPGAPVSLAGEYYHLDAAAPGPFPRHSIGIRLGAYGPRMLALTGRVADGWVPSEPYAPVDALAEMTKRIDDAALSAGRDPSRIERWYHILRPSGNPRGWAQRLTELALTHAISGFILVPGPDPEHDLHGFAEEVAAEVRELVAAERSRSATAEPEPAGTADTAAEPVSGSAGPASGTSTAVTAATTTTDPDPEMNHAVQTILRRAPATDESATAAHLSAARPTAPKHPDAPTTPVGRASASFLVEIHDHLRRELAEIRRALEQLATGQLGPDGLRSVIHQTTMRQNYWSVGSFCATYCRLLTLHHGVEDHQTFADVRAFEPALDPVLTRLGEEHELIAELLTRLDSALVALLSDPKHLATVTQEYDNLAEFLQSHLDYEEQELLGPLARSTIRI
ncbi:MAG TPA: LLM class flavin-dependent oxidoreductase [Actinocrinis sp.]|jgi:hemerythrin-like domain-containing protein